MLLRGVLLGGCAAFIGAVGQDANLLEEVKDWRAELAAHVKDNDNVRSARMSWQRARAPGQVLPSAIEARRSTTQTDDELTRQGEYTQKHVDPDNNGFGHQQASVLGCPRGVLMPGNRVEDQAVEGQLCNHRHHSPRQLFGAHAWRGHVGKQLIGPRESTQATIAVMSIGAMLASCNRLQSSVVDSSSSTAGAAQGAQSSTAACMAASRGVPVAAIATATAPGFHNMIQRLPSTALATSRPGASAGQGQSKTCECNCCQH